MSSKSHLKQGIHHSNCPKRFCPMSYIVEESAIASLGRQMVNSHASIHCRTHASTQTQVNTKTIVNISLIALCNVLALRQRRTHKHTLHVCLHTHRHTHMHTHTDTHTSGHTHSHAHTHTHEHTNLAIDIVVHSYARIKVVSARLGRLGDVALAAVGRARVQDDEHAVERLPVSWSMTTTASELCVKKRKFYFTPVEIQSL